MPAKTEPPDLSLPTAVTSSATSDTSVGRSAVPPVSSEGLPTEAEVRTSDLEQIEEHEGEGRQARIRDAAHAAYVRRGSEPGGELQDWLEAEREVDAQANEDRSD